MTRALASLALLFGLVAAAPQAGPSQTVDAFYRWYIGATRNGYWATAFDGAKPYMEPSLWQAVDTAVKRGEHEGHTFLNFDPFDYAQQPASSYLLGKATGSGTLTNVPVTIRFEHADAVTFVVRLKHDGGRWLIDDFAYQSGNTLRGVLAKAE
jgi:hypothetical protein